MRKLININDDWEFTPAFDDDFLNGESDMRVTTVRLPHTCKVTPYNYFDENIYQMVCGYRKRLDLNERGNRRAFICFGAAAHYAKVYLDGELIGEHKSGYTAFEFELVTDNPAPLLAVELDTRESLNFPPFGKVIDYMTYGGLYREVRLEFREDSYIADLFAKPSIPESIRVTPKMNPKLVAGITFDGVIDCDMDIIGSADAIHYSVFEKDSDRAIYEVTVNASKYCTLTIPRVHLWDPLSPALYEMKAELIKDGAVIDTLSRRVGFRRSEFKKDGFY
ncbi:MAG: glycoside hydrolase family 2 protein, partial [Ruminococcus sp.]|nr:glycoside hydrolase family 2 protein [Ruminococcus sp.]